MIYQTIKLQVTSDKLQVRRQSGVTLLLAILVLSSILAISFSIASILFIEIQTSGDLLRTEPTYYGASGVSEEAIFNVIRKVCSGENCNYTTQFNNNVTISPPQQTSTTTPLFQDTVPPGSNFSTAKTYSFYNPSNPNAVGSGYGKLSLTYLSSGNQNDPLDVYLCQFDASGQTVYNSTPCTDPNDTSTPPYWIQQFAQGPVVMDPSANPSESWTLDPTKQQELILFNGNTSSTNNIFVSIETYAGDGVTPLGLPYAGETAVQINASNADVSRKIRVVVPNSVTAGGSTAATALVTTSSGGYTDSQSRTWCQDTSCPNLSISGGTIFNTSNAISNTSDQPLYQTERYGNFSYTLSGLTPNSAHKVILKFAEIYWNSPGQRVFDVSINGNPVLTNFDIVQDAGSNFKADDKTFSVTADGSGAITIQFTGVIDNAKVDSVEVD